MAKRRVSVFLVAMFIGVLLIRAGRGFVLGEEESQSTENVPFQEKEIVSDVDILSSTEFLDNTETLSDTEAKSTENWIDIEAEYGKVAYLEWGEEVVLAVKDIFGENGYYEEFSLELSQMITPVECVKFLDENRIYISYRSGESMENRDVVLELGRQE